MLDNNARNNGAQTLFSLSLFLSFLSSYLRPSPLVSSLSLSLFTSFSFRSTSNYSPVHKRPPSRQFHSPPSPSPTLAAALSNSRPLADFSARFPAGGENRPRKNSAKTKSNGGNSAARMPPKKGKKEMKEEKSNSIDPRYQPVCGLFVYRLISFERFFSFFLSTSEILDRRMCVRV